MKHSARHVSPVTVKPGAKSWGFIAKVLTGRADTVSMWPELAYDVGTKTGRLLNQTYMLCNHPDAVRHVMLDRHENYDIKSPMQREWLAPLIGDGLFVSDGDLWKARRKACTPALSNDLLPQYAGIMCDSVNDLSRRWSALAPSSSVDMLQEMAVLTACIIGRAVFGDEISEAEAMQVVQGFARYQEVAEHVDLSLLLGLPMLGRLKSRRRQRQIAEAAADVHEIVDAIISRDGRKRPAGRPTLPAILRQARCPGGEVAVRNEAIVMFMAGHETTANTLAWIWYLLDGAPEIAARMHAELDEVLAGRTPTLEDLPKLVYTRAIADEALRLYPPVAAMGRVAREADVVCERRIGAGTIMLIMPWLLHRHRRHWDNPDAFIPERFLPDAPRVSKFLYIPFSAGHRICLGLRFGLTEVLLCLATLAQKFQPRLKAGHAVEVSCQLTLRPKGGLPMTIERRT